MSTSLPLYDETPGQLSVTQRREMDLDLVNMFLIAGGTLAIPILAFVASFLLWPAALIKVYYWYWRRTLGLQVKHAESDGYRFCYSYRGKPGTRPSILMLHGFSAHKDMWLTVVKYLPKHLHLVCVDMPGHEGTSRTCAEDYSIEGQVRRIHQMKFCDTFLRFFNVFIFLLAVFLEIVGEKSRHSLQENMHLITVPLQVIWGKQDQVVDVSGATVLASGVRGCRVDLLENCGHSVVMERPRKTAKLILEFLIAEQDSSSKKIS
ncbi:UNVERIFIED_CONTAM: hypothetical protein FKN15_072940 [Acipenser sinensis]